jgi:hypothetical protein
MTYKVGYRRPPIKSRFKAGKSGNPKGRSKGSSSLKTDVLSEFAERITVRERGAARKLTKQRALIKSLMAKALSGDIRAISTLIFLHARLIAGTVEEPADELSEYEKSVLRRIAPKLFKA